jgi:DNA-binding NarL/FixJ family response regulator
MSLTVYVVDDSPLVRQRIETLLGRIDGARIVGQAECADEAIARIPALLPRNSSS